jgi:uncharacterized protein with HEPN domain
MLLALERLEGLLGRKRDWVAVAAAERQLEILGEAARGISDETRKEHPEIPWSKLVKLRHEVAHEYFRLDSKRMWEAAERVISFRKAIKNMLAEG